MTAKKLETVATNTLAKVGEGFSITKSHLDLVANIPGAELAFTKTEAATVPTKGRILDHIGFDVRDHTAFVKRLEAAGIKLDEPPRTTASGNLVTYITDPWGTRVEIVQRASLGPQVR